MKEVLLKIVQTDPEPNRKWSSQLWSGLTGAPGGTQMLAGGTGAFTQAQLEAPLADGTPMDRASVLRKIRTQDQPDPQFAEIGKRLYELLQTTGTADTWRALRKTEQQAGGTNPGLRTYLELPGYLDEWPWELLAWNIDTGLEERAFDAAGHPMVRMTRQPDLRTAWSDSTVRILLVSGEEKLDDENLASTELRSIRKIFQEANLSVLVDVCEAPAKVDILEERIQTVAPHILHFIGHGDFVAGADFALEFMRGERWYWAADRIHRCLSNLPTKPRLVILNSCHSSRREAHATSVTNAILHAGVPAVVGALAALQITYARSFSEAFYGALAKQKPLDQAMAAARVKLSGMAQYAGMNQRYWALPVLTVGAPVEGILKLKRALVMNRCEVAGDVFSRPGKFVNRISDRWSMLSTFRPVDPAVPAFRGLIIESTSGQVGKTWLIKRVMRDFLDSDFIVRYATLVGAASRTSLDVLEEWRGRPGLVSPVLTRLPGPHFEDFDRALAAAREDPNATHIGEAFRTFKAGFQSLRQEKNVLLVLGRLREKNQPTVSSQDFRESLLEKLLLPIQATSPADPEVAGLHALLIVRQHNDLPLGQPSDLEEFALSRISLDVPESTRTPEDGFRRLTVGEFPSDEVDRHFDEFAEFGQSELIDALRTAVKLCITPGTWSPAKLQLFEPIIGNALGRR